MDNPGHLCPEDQRFVAGVLKAALIEYHFEGRREEPGHLTGGFNYLTCPHPMCAKYRRIIAEMGFTIEPDSRADS